MKRRFKYTEETRKKISQIMMGNRNGKNSLFQKGNKINVGKKRSEETKKKISEANKGKKRSKEFKKRMSEIHKGKKFSSRLGKKHSKETRKKMSKAHKEEKHWNWQGGISFEEYGIDWTDDLKESIRKRDNYICNLCGIHQDELDGRHKKLDIHHIDYDKYNLNPNNLITLCRNCHMKTNYNRKYWIEKFG